MGNKFNIGKVLTTLVVLPIALSFVGKSNDDINYSNDFCKTFKDKGQVHTATFYQGQKMLLITDPTNKEILVYASGSEKEFSKSPIIADSKFASSDLKELYNNIYEEGCNCKDYENQGAPLPPKSHCKETKLNK